uniref:Uncharacterized protein n=1 Tax=Arundo donax TaxID=35708 RepID=A0A0A9BAT4_ARUDO
MVHLILNSTLIHLKWQPFLHPPLGQSTPLIFPHWLWPPSNQ